MQKHTNEKSQSKFKIQHLQILNYIKHKLQPLHPSKSLARLPRLKQNICHTVHMGQIETKQYKFDIKNLLNSSNSHEKIYKEKIRKKQQQKKQYRLNKTSKINCNEFQSAQHLVKNQSRLKKYHKKHLLSKIEQNYISQNKKLEFKENNQNLKTSQTLKYQLLKNAKQIIKQGKQKLIQKAFKSKDCQNKQNLSFDYAVSKLKQLEKEENDQDQKSDPYESVSPNKLNKYIALFENYNQKLINWQQNVFSRQFKKKKNFAKKQNNKIGDDDFSRDERKDLSVSNHNYIVRSSNSRSSIYLIKDNQYQNNKQLHFKQEKFRMRNNHKKVVALLSKKSFDSMYI